MYDIYLYPTNLFTPLSFPLQIINHPPCNFPTFQKIFVHNFSHYLPTICSQIAHKTPQNKPKALKKCPKCGKKTSNNKRQNRQLPSLNDLIISGFPYVGATGFEPTTPCSQSRCANRTALRPVLFRNNVLSQKRCKGMTFFYTGQTFC